MSSLSLFEQMNNVDRQIPFCNVHLMYYTCSLCDEYIMDSQTLKSHHRFCKRNVKNQNAVNNKNEKYNARRNK